MTGWRIEHSKPTALYMLFDAADSLLYVAEHDVPIRGRGRAKPAATTGGRRRVRITDLCPSRNKPVFPVLAASSEAIISAC